MCIWQGIWSVYFNTIINQKQLLSVFFLSPNGLLVENALSIKSANAPPVHNVLNKLIIKYKHRYRYIRNIITWDPNQVITFIPNYFLAKTLIFFSSWTLFKMSSTHGAFCSMLKLAGFWHYKIRTHSILYNIK